jgi:hypothetical protein
MPPLTPEQTQAVLMYLMQMGMDPAATNLTFGRTPIDLDKSGNPLPQDLTQQTAALSYQRGQNTLFADPVTGIGAGASGYDPAAFEPVVDREHPIDRPGSRQLDYYLNRSPGTMGSLIAQHIAGGGDASSAYASVMQILEGPDSDDKAMLMASIPDARDNMGQLVTDTDKMPVKDFGSIFKFAQDLESKVASDPAEGAYVDPQTGESYNVSESPAAKEFTDKGWFLPTDRYSIEQLMGPDWMGRTGGVTDPNSMEAMLQGGIVAPAREAARTARQAYAAGGQDVALGGPKTGARVERPGGRPGTPGGIARLTPEQALRLSGSPGQGQQGLSGISQGGAMMRDVLGGKGIQDLVNQTGIPGLLGQEPINLQGSGAPSGIGRMGPSAPGSQSPQAKALAAEAKAASIAAQKAFFDTSRERRQTFGKDYWLNKGRLDAATEQGRTPLMDQFLARRMATISGGLPGGYLPGG